MTDPVSDLAEHTVEAVLHTGLAHGDALLGTIAPVLRHLIINEDHSFFGDEIIARTRGMLDDLASQLLAAVDREAGRTTANAPSPEALDALAVMLAAQPGLLGHLHATALEWQLTERMQGRLSLDPVLTPLLQALIASPEPEVARTAMALLAAQARFAQGQRRMQLALDELPGDLLHGALLALRQYGAGAAEDERFAAAEASVRQGYDEARGRIRLIARLVSGMGAGFAPALIVSHAGVAIFLSALAMASGQERALAVLATNEGQRTRLALSLRAGGLKPEAVREQLAAIHPELALPAHFDGLGADRAAAILASSVLRTGDRA